MHNPFKIIFFFLDHSLQHLATAVENIVVSPCWINLPGAHHRGSLNLSWYVLPKFQIIQIQHKIK